MSPKDSKYKALKEAFKIQQPLCEAILDPYAVVTAEGTIVACNDLFPQMVEYDKEDVIDKSIFDVFKFNIGQKVLGPDDLFKETHVRHDEVFCNRKQSPDENRKVELGLIEDIRFVILSAVPLLTANSGIVGYFLNIRDVTEEALLQEEYKEKSNQSMTDPLTGLRNRNYLEQYLDAQFNHFVMTMRNSANKSPSLSVVMADIDHFKKINDTYGHQAGDFILKKLSSIIEDSVRKTDVVCRYGGEEFILFLQGTDSTIAATVANKVRKKIEEATYQFEGQSINVTSSFGVSQLSVDDKDPYKLIARADEALYHSKERGRNRVTIYETMTAKKAS